MSCDLPALGDKNEDAIVRELIDEFQRDNPDIRIVRTNTGSPPQLATKLQTMLSAGDPPDVFYLESERLADFAAKGLLADFEQPIRQDIEQGLGPADGDEFVDLPDYFEPVVNAFRYDGHQVGKGPLYGLPKDFTPVGFYYNKGSVSPGRRTFPVTSGLDLGRIHRRGAQIGELPGCYGADFVTWEAIIRIYLFTWGTDFTGPGFEEFYLDDRPYSGRSQRWLPGSMRKIARCSAPKPNSRPGRSHSWPVTSAWPVVRPLESPHLSPHREIRLGLRAAPARAGHAPRQRRAHRGLGHVRPK